MYIEDVLGNGSSLGKFQNPDLSTGTMYRIGTWIHNTAVNVNLSYKGIYVTYRHRYHLLYMNYTSHNS